MDETSKTSSSPSLWLMRGALSMLKRGEVLNGDHPLVVIEDGIDMLAERIDQLEWALRRLQGMTHGEDTQRIIREALASNQDSRSE